MTRAWISRRGAGLLRLALLFAGLAPLLPPLARGVPGLQVLGLALEEWFRFQCHRDPARSLALWGHLLLPVCSRCLGIYSGLGLGALILYPRLGARGLRIWVGLAAVAMIVDVSSESLGIRPASTLLRLATGIALSYPVGVALVVAARGAAPPRDPGPGSVRGASEADHPA